MVRTKKTQWSLWWCRIRRERFGRGGRGGSRVCEPITDFKWGWLLRILAPKSPTVCLSSAQHLYSLYSWCCKSNCQRYIQKKCIVQHSASVMHCGIMWEIHSSSWKPWKTPSPSSCYGIMPSGGTHRSWLWKGCSGKWKTREGRPWQLSAQTWRCQWKFELCVFLMFVYLFHFISMYHNAYVIGLVFDMSLPESYVYMIQCYLIFTIFIIFIDPLTKSLALHILFTFHQPTAVIYRSNNLMTQNN